MSENKLKDIEKQLINMGYREFQITRVMKQNAYKFFQKCIKSEFNKLYYIGIYIWQHDIDISLEANLQFRNDYNGLVINLDITQQNNDINVLEKHIHDIWYRMGYDNYE